MTLIEQPCAIFQKNVTPPTGFALIFASKLALPIVVLAALFVLDRIRKEEELLASHFGSEFTAYRCRTRKLIPQMF